MKDFSNINEILDFAIQNEQNAYEFYIQLAGKARNQDMKNTFEHFALEESNHKARLLKMKEEGVFQSEMVSVADLKISDYLVLDKSEEDMSYQNALVLAMKREKAAFKLYTKLTTKTNNPEIVRLFQLLAQEESKHKLIFEIEYDEYVLREN